MSEISNLLDSNGFAFIPSYRSNEETIISISNIGKIASIPGIDQVQALIPNDHLNSNPNTYSGNYGLSMFPLHTDLAHWHWPPRYFALRCVIGSEYVPTRLLDTKELISEIGHTKLKRALVKSRRPVNGKYFLLRLLENTKDQKELFRWDSLFINPANDYCKNVIRDVRDYLNVVNEKDVYLINRGDTLIIDNWKMLHGRAPINQSALNRKIERVYLTEVY